MDSLRVLYITMECLKVCFVFSLHSSGILFFFYVVRQVVPYNGDDSFIIIVVIIIVKQSFLVTSLLCAGVMPTF